MYKKMAKKVLKKYKGGAIDQIVKDPELKAGGGAIHHPVKAQPEDLVKKKKEGGYVKKDREELKSEVKGMGPEGKAYLRDELKGKKYEGKLKGKYKGDLDKELSGMHARGKEYLKDLVKKSVRREGEGKAPEKKRSVKREGEKEYGHKDFPERAGYKMREKIAKGIRREGEKPSLGKIIESKALKFKLREGEKIPKKDIVKKAHGGWMQSAVKKPGALRAVAKKDKLIKGDEKLSSSDLSKLGSKAKKSGNSLLAKRVSLAKTFAKMRKK
jgi:hypothetical protein